MPLVVLAWGDITAAAVKVLFNGTDSSIQTLGSLIGGGRMLTTSLDVDVDLQGYVKLVLYAYSIPTVWSLSGTSAVVIDTGYPCGTKNPLHGSLPDHIAEATFACYNGKIYYLVFPKGDEEDCGINNPFTGQGGTCVTNSFSAPPGLDKLRDGLAGGVSVADLVKG